MINIARAELFRFRKSGIFMWLMFLAALAGGLTIYFGGDMSANDLMNSYGTNTQMFINMMILVVCTVLGIFVGVSYNNRINYYEIMNGSNPYKIILTKSITLGTVGALIMFVPVAVCFLISYIKNGSGGITNVALFFVLLFAVMLHASIVTVMYSMLARNLALASFVSYIRIGILDMVVFLVAFEISPEFAAEHDVLSVTLNGQFAGLMSPEYTGSFIAYVLLSLIIECAVLYILLYFIYKRKKFK